MFNLRSKFIVLLGCAVCLSGCVAFSSYKNSQSKVASEQAAEQVSHPNKAMQQSKAKRSKKVALGMSAKPTKFTSGKLPKVKKARLKQGKIQKVRKMDKGGVLFSFTSSGPDFHANPILMYRHLSQDVSGQVPMLNLFNDGTRSVFSNAYGALKLLVLKPGLYEFNQWQVGLPGPEFNFVNEKPFHILFKVIPGQISYIGNINLGLNFDEEKNPLFAITVYNFFNRDSKAFRRLYGKYRRLPIHERIASVEHHLDMKNLKNRWITYRDYYEN